MLRRSDHEGGPQSAGAPRRGLSFVAQILVRNFRGVLFGEFFAPSENGYFGKIGDKNSAEFVLICCCYGPEIVGEVLFRSSF